MVVQQFVESNWTGYLDEVFYGEHISYFDVSQIEDFSRLFADQTGFNEPFDDWDTSSALDMQEMFSGATASVSTRRWVHGTWRN